jgi:hypothetical protein
MTAESPIGLFLGVPGPVDPLKWLDFADTFPKMVLNSRIPKAQLEATYKFRNIAKNEYG